MARITIDLSKGVFEVEGSEEFVEKRFTEFQPQLASAIQRSNPALQELSHEASSKQSKRAQTKKRSNKAETPDIFKKVDILPTKLDSGVAYSKLKTPQDRLAWSLTLANELGFDGLTNNEVAWLTDKLGNGIASKHITVNYQRARDKGLVNQSTLTSKMRITDEGLKYISSLSTEQKAA